MKYFIVTTKCGHVGKWSCIWIDFAVPAESAKHIKGSKGIIKM